MRQDWQDMLDMYTKEYEKSPNPHELHSIDSVVFPKSNFANLDAVETGVYSGCTTQST